MLFDYSFNITALTFISVLAIYYHISPIFPNRANKLFSRLLIETTFTVSLDIATFFCINNKVYLPVNYIVNIIFFLIQWIIPYHFLKYIIALTKHEFNIKSITRILPTMIISFNYALLLSTPFTHLIFYFDNEMNYVHGKLYFFSLFLEMFLLVWGAGFSIKKRNFLTKSQVIIIPLYIVIGTIATVIQTIIPSISIISASICLSVFLMYITLLNPTAYIDTMTNVYNRMAFNEYIYTLIAKKVPFNFIVIDIAGTSKINSLISENFGNHVIKKIALELKSIISKSLIFRIEGDRFIIISEKDKTKLLTLKKLETLFPLTISKNDIRVEIDVHIAFSDTLSDIKSTSEIIELITFICKKAKNSLSKSRLHLDNIYEYRYNKAIHDAISFAIENEEIELFLQPIYCKKNNQFNSAEALCRINTKQFGYISPSVFIPYAERKGLINQLSLTMIKKVCNYLCDEELPSFFKNISINLSVIDCLDPTLPKKIINILKKYNIKNNQISFEVTESTASNAPQLEKTMTLLVKEGISFSMDDFGTGYANLDSVLRLPFSIAKIDRALLLLAQESKKYKVLISSLTNLIKNIDLEIVIEGVETINQIEFLSNLEIDYYQGYYYSEPLSIKDFTQFISKQNNQFNGK
ncbi:MAG: GGDEF domain-containing protein [Spirochaetia bacterium]|nr:GGDEF domain-containing protein [Spirochaetia bacterium]